MRRLRCELNSPRHIQAYARRLEREAVEIETSDAQQAADLRQAAALDRDSARDFALAPTATKPQAWASGVPILLLQVLLGLEPDREREVLRSNARDVPSWVGRLRLAPVQAFGSDWEVRVEDGTVSVTPA